YTLSYAFSRDIDDFQSLVGATQRTPFAPDGYNRGPSVLERRSVLTFNGVYMLPVGRGKRWGSAMPRIADAVLGGGELSSIDHFASGQPVAFQVPGTTLGNGYNTRPILLGDPHLDQPSVSRWFNPNYVDASGCHALVAGLPCTLGLPKLYTFGN